MKIQLAALMTLTNGELAEIEYRILHAYLDVLQVSRDREALFDEVTALRAALAKADAHIEELREKVALS